MNVHLPYEGYSRNAPCFIY